jgi:soluble lytic murein transglycosylase-like protein
LKLFLLVVVLGILLWLALRTTAMRASDSPYADIIAHASSEYNVPQDWIAAVISTESSWNPNAVGSSGEIGLMQVLPTTAYGLGYSGPVQDMYDPDLNIHLGTQLLGQLRTHYGNDLSRVYSAYNSGDPDAYKTNPQVAAHVQNLLNNYQRITA